MFLLSIVIFFAVVGSIFSLLKSYGNRTGVNWDYDIRHSLGEWRFVFYLFAVIFLILYVSVGFICYSVQISNSETLLSVDKTEIVLQEKADNLTKQFTIYLAETYPNFEKQIFEKIAPDNVDIYFARYPDLKSSETIRVLVDQIHSLRNDVYSQKLERIKIVRDMRFLTRCPWVPQWMMPSIPVPEY